MVARSPTVGAPLDAPAAARCGDGIADPGETCDGDERDCAELGAVLVSGSAPCRADCRGWDPDGCARATGAAREMVKPAERDPRWAGARCNDGTPFGFIFRPATPPSGQWV